MDMKTAVKSTCVLWCSSALASVVNLRCEYRENPSGIDVEKPRLSWVIEDRDSRSEVGEPRSEVRGQKQTAYQVLVASTPELLAKDNGDLWDSGKLESDQSIQVEYAGTPLASRQQCFWKVRVWVRNSRFRVQVSGFRADSDSRRGRSKRSKSSFECPSCTGNWAGSDWEYYSSAEHRPIRCHCIVPFPR